MRRRVLISCGVIAILILCGGILAWFLVLRGNVFSSSPKVDSRVKDLSEVTLFGEVLNSGEDWSTYAYSFDRAETEITKLFSSIGPTESLSSMEPIYLGYVTPIKQALVSNMLYTEISDNVEGDYALVLRAFDLDMTCNFVLYSHIYGYQSVCCAFLLNNSSQEMLTAVDYQDMVAKIQLYTGVVIADSEIENAVSAVMQAAPVGGNYIIFLQDEEASVSVSVYNFSTDEECWRVDSLIVVDPGLSGEEWESYEWEVELPTTGED